jgi:hypothetical protein
MKIGAIGLLAAALVLAGAPLGVPAAPRLPPVWAPDEGIVLAQRQTQGGKGGGEPRGGEGGESTRFTNRFIQENPIFGVTRRALEATEAASRRFRRNIDRCPLSDPMLEFNRCIAEALEIYADELEQPVVALPPPLKPVPTVIRRAAAKVRAAPTRKAARAAVAEAVKQVRKSITLIKAEEPAFASLADMQTRQGTIIAQNLERADAKLERAIGL